MKVGDTITIAGSYKTAPNPLRQWWQFWKPRVIETKELIHYKITGGIPLPAPPEALPPLPGDGI